MANPDRTLSRRDFLKLLGAGATALAAKSLWPVDLTFPTKTQVPPTTADDIGPSGSQDTKQGAPEDQKKESSHQALAQAVIIGDYLDVHFLDGRPNAYAKVPRVPGTTVGILGYGPGNYTFLNAPNQEIPITQVQIIKGQPKSIDQMPTHPYLGARNDVAFLMEPLKEWGTNNVLIEIPYYGFINTSLATETQLTRGKLAKESLTAAKYFGYIPNLIYNPTRFMDEAAVKTDILILLATCNSIGIKQLYLTLGNEPDSKEFWTQGFNEYAKFVKIAADETEIFKKSVPGFKATLVISALSDYDKAAEFYSALKQAQLPMANFEYSIHAYLSASQVTKRTNKVIRALGFIPPGIQFTELGIPAGYDRTQIVAMLDAVENLRNSGMPITKAYVFEYGVWTNSHYGYIDPRTFLRDPQYYLIPSWVLQKLRG